jgi:hypothetical protein
MGRLAGEVARVARSKYGSRLWRVDAVKDNFKKGTNKCNKFVLDVLVEAGAAVPQVSVWLGIKHRPPTAGEWADPGEDISGWVVVTEPKPGDVVAEAITYSDATGHCGIVVGPNETASANSLLGGNIDINDYGFREDDAKHGARSKCVFRRCIQDEPPPDDAGPPAADALDGGLPPGGTP